MTQGYLTPSGESNIRSHVWTFTIVFARLDAGRSWSALMSVFIYRDGQLSGNDFNEEICHGEENVFLMNRILSPHKTSLKRTALGFP